MFFQEVCQALTRKEERHWSLVETVKLREKSLLRKDAGPREDE